MDRADYNKLYSEVNKYDVEIEDKRYDDYAEHSIDVSGSKGTLMCLVEELNEEFPDLGLTERDIQETGASCLLRFTVYEDFDEDL